MKTIKIVITDKDGVVLDIAEVEIDNGCNQVTVLAHESTITPNAAHHWVADLDIGKGKEWNEASQLP